MTDSVEAARQDVEQEAADELVGAECHDALPVGAVTAIILVAECDAGLVEGEEASVRDGDPVRIPREVGEHRFGAGEGRLGIDDPAFVADRREVTQEGAPVGERCEAAEKGKLAFFGQSKDLGDRREFVRHVALVRKKRWVVYAKKPFGGPHAVLAYLSRYTHRVAIANSRLITCDRDGVTFRWKDYRLDGRERFKTMTLATSEFIRRFLIHVLPGGFHRIRHYGLFASGSRIDNIARARQLLAVPPPPRQPEGAPTHDSEPKTLAQPCPCCGGRMIVIETFQRGSTPRYRPSAPPAAIRIDTS